MASLLDVLVSQRNPQVGGLLGVGQDGGAPAPRQPQQDGFMARLFGSNDPSVSPEVNAEAQQQAQLMSALGILASGQEGLGGIAEGIFAGRQVADEVRDRAIAGQRLALARRRNMIDEAAFISELRTQQAERTEEQQRAARLAEVFSQDRDGSGTISLRTVDAALTGALQAGDLEAAKELRQLRSQFEEEKPVFTSISRDGQTVTARVMPDGSLQDPLTGKPLSEKLFRKLPEPRTPKERQDRIDALSDDARGDLEDAKHVATAVRIGLGVPNNRVGATTLFTMMTRAIDPGVSVREADIKRGEAAATLTGRAENLYNLWLEEGQLNEAQFNWLKGELRRVGQAQQEAMGGLREYWEKRARNARVDPDLVVPPDVFEGAFDTSDEDEDEDEEDDLIGDID